jgi:hypothetical protein
MPPISYLEWRPVPITCRLSNSWAHRRDVSTVPSAARLLTSPMLTIPAGRPIDVRDGTVECDRTHETQIEGFLKSGEQGQPFTEGHRVNQEPVLVDETGPHQALREARSAVREEILAGLLL